MSPRVGFRPGFPGDYPVRPANLLQIDWFASTRNMINLWLPEAIGCRNLGTLLFILHEDVGFRFERTAEGHWRHTLVKPGCLSFEAVTKEIPSGLAMELAVTNLGGRDWESADAGICTQFHAAPDFYDPERRRTFYLSGGKMRMMTGPVNSTAEDACRFYGPTRQDHYPPADAGFIGIASADGHHTAATWWEGAETVWGNAHPATLCIHSDPRFGDVPAGATIRRRGHLYLMDGSPEDALARFLRERA